MIQSCVRGRPRGRFTLMLGPFTVPVEVGAMHKLSASPSSLWRGHAKRSSVRSPPKSFLVNSLMANRESAWIIIYSKKKKTNFGLVP